MCVHPKLDRGTDQLGYVVNSLEGVCDDFDSCDYIENLNGPFTDDLIIVQLNIRGIGSKISKLKYFLNHSFLNCEPDIIVISETWLTEQSPIVDIPGYVFIHQPRTFKKGGGVGFLIKHNVHTNVVKHVKFRSSEFESMFIEVKLKNSDRITVGSIYQSPNTSASLFNSEYGEVLCELKKRNTKAIILGMDHNMDLLHSNTHQHTEDFLQMNLDQMLMPTITRPTHITKTSATLIDNIIVSQSLCTRYDSNVLIEDLSDHLPSVCVIKDANLSRKMPITINSRDTRKQNLAALKQSLSNVKWSDLNGDDDVNLRANQLRDILVKKIDHFVPVKSHSIKYKNIRREPWVSAGILYSIKYSKKLYAKSIRANATSKTISDYKDYNKLLQKIKRVAKKSYYGEMCTRFKSNTKKLWKIINEISGKTNNKDGLIDSLKVDNIHVYESKRIANRFGKYFSTVGETFAKKIPNLVRYINSYLEKIWFNNQSIFMEPCTPSEIRKLLRQLPPKNSSGYDNISNVLLKEIGPYIIDILVELFNMSIQHGIFSDTMKIAEVVPLHKGKERFLENNYRPISLLTTISKLLEKVVCTRVYKFLDTTGQINPT